MDKLLLANLLIKIYYLFCYFLVTIIFLRFFFRGLLRRFCMKRMAKELKLNFKVRDKLIVAKEFKLNIISGVYKNKHIEIYDKHEGLGLIAFGPRRRFTVINIDGKEIYNSFNEFFILSYFPSVKRILNKLERAISENKK